MAEKALASPAAKPLKVTRHRIKGLPLQEGVFLVSSDTSTNRLALLLLRELKTRKVPSTTLEQAVDVSLRRIYSGSSNSHTFQDGFYTAYGFRVVYSANLKHSYAQGHSVQLGYPSTIIGASGKPIEVVKRHSGKIVAYNEGVSFELETYSGFRRTFSTERVTAFNYAVDAKFSDTGYVHLSFKVADENSGILELTVTRLQSDSPKSVLSAETLTQEAHTRALLRKGDNQDEAIQAASNPISPVGGISEPQAYSSHETANCADELWTRLRAAVGTVVTIRGEYSAKEYSEVHGRLESLRRRGEEITLALNGGIQESYKLETVTLEDGNS